VRVLELFAGIGGMRLALSYGGIRIEEAIAVEVNEQALSVYRHNFGETGLVRRDLTGLNAAWFERQRCRIWTMSPPCQPYTRQGKNRDAEDARAKPLLHIIDVLREVPTPPEVLVLENVQNFERSESCARLLEVLAHRGFEWRGFLLSPRQFGFPNARQRFYLVAKQRGSAFASVPRPRQDVDAAEASCTPWSRLPCPGACCASSQEAEAGGASASSGALWTEEALVSEGRSLEEPMGRCAACGREAPVGEPRVVGEDCGINQDGDKAELGAWCRWPVAEVGSFLDGDDGSSTSSRAGAAQEPSQWEVPEQTLCKESARCFDVVHPGCRHSLCFTKAYGRYIDGTGSVFLMTDRPPRPPSSEVVGDAFAMREFLGLLRYFSPREAAQMLGFKLRDPVPDGSVAPCPAAFGCLPLCSAHGAEALRRDVGNPCCCPPYSLPGPETHGPGGDPLGAKSGRGLWALLGNSLNPQVVALVCRACGVPEALGQRRGAEVD